MLDFGIAKAAGRMQVTQDGRIKGKFGYMPPEQLHGEVLDRRADIYAAGVVLWEALVGARLFAGRGDAPDFARLLEASVDPPSSKVRMSPAYDAVVLRALAREAQSRWPTALEMAEALEACGPVAPPAAGGAWVTDVAGDLLAELSGRIAAIETRLVSGIRDSLYLLETIDSRVMRLDELGTLRESPPGATALLASLPAPSVPPPAATADEPPAPVSAPATGRPTLTPDPLPGRTSAMLWTVVAAGGAVAIAATFAIIASIAGSAAPAAHLHGTSTTEPSASTATAAGETLPAPSATAEVASAQPPAPAAPPPSATATATASATQAASPPSSPRAKVTAPTPVPHRPAAGGCSPPFTIDAEGHKHYKRECLR